MQVFGGNPESSLSIAPGYTTDPKPLGILIQLFLSSSCLVFLEFKLSGTEHPWHPNHWHSLHGCTVHPSHEQAQKNTSTVSRDLLVTITMGLEMFVVETAISLLTAQFGPMHERKGFPANISWQSWFVISQDRWEHTMP